MHFVGKTATMSTKKGSGMLGAAIYDEVIKFCFSYTIIKQESETNIT